MAAIAARTTRLEIATDILILPLYHAVKLAGDIATVDILSNGRVMPGVGAGYRDEEFAAFGSSRRDRPRRMEEGVAVLRGCWGDGPFSFAGRHYQLDQLDVTPRPVRKPHGDRRRPTGGVLLARVARIHTRCMCAELRWR